MRLVIMNAGHTCLRAALNKADSPPGADVK